MPKKLLTVKELTEFGLDSLVQKYDEEKELYKQEVEENNFERSLLFLPSAIKWTHHNRFAKAFQVDYLDNIADRLLQNILAEKIESPSCANEMILLITIQQAEKEQYEFCLNLRKLINQGVKK